MSLQIHQNIKDKLGFFYESHKIPNLLFHGATGSGKRTIVNEFISKIYDGDRDKIKAFVIIIGHEIASIIPYPINKMAPIEFIILSFIMFFIKNEIINTKEAK